MLKQLVGPKGKKWWEPVLLVFLFWYPLRHIHMGLDFWDTGYNYANFLYMGTEHMDSMWLFSTYLANAVGHLLTKLPGAQTLAGMNLYTGLLVSVLAIGGYLFCTRKLGMQEWIVFVGEFAAISLCWCPTALLYNYLTYVLFTGCVALLYVGLTEKKYWCLFGAGVCLGSNVLVRFSNLPEAALILAVWFYAFLEGWEQRREAVGSKATGGRDDVDGRAGADGRKGACGRAGADGGKGVGGRDGIDGGKRAGGSKSAGNRDVKADVGGNGLRRAVRYTAWCLGGYLAALLVLFGWIQLRYGLDHYVEGIGRLFAMTDKATDYKAGSMVKQLIMTYVENLYWIVRIGVIMIVGIVGFGVAEKAAAFIGRLDGVTDVSQGSGRHGAAGEAENSRGRSLGREAEKSAGGELFRGEIRLLWCGVVVLMVMWLYARGFCAMEYDNYGAILRPGISFLTLTLGICVIRILQPSASREEKLLGVLIGLTVLLTSIGSNNGIYPSLNHLFLAAPYTLWQCWGFLWEAEDLTFQTMKKGRPVWNFEIRFFPVKAVLTALLVLFLFQGGRFGWNFVFAEATGAKDMYTVVGNNEVLKGVRMSGERADWMADISMYVEANGLQGREVILFGSIPSMSFYLQMPSAFNPWSDLDSYHEEVMRQALLQEAEEVRQGKQRPVVLLEASYVMYLEGGEEALLQAGFSEKAIEKIAEKDGKLGLLKTYLEELRYGVTFRNEKFVMME